MAALLLRGPPPSRGIRLGARGDSSGVGGFGWGAGGFGWGRRGIRGGASGDSAGGVGGFGWGRRGIRLGASGDLGGGAGDLGGALGIRVSAGCPLFWRGNDVLGRGDSLVREPATPNAVDCSGDGCYTACY